MKWETFDLKKSEKPRKKTVGPLVRLLWRAAAPGLKHLRLPRARVRKCVCVCERAYVCKRATVHIQHGISILARAFVLIRAKIEHSFRWAHHRLACQGQWRCIHNSTRCTTWGLSIFDIASGRHGKMCLRLDHFGGRRRCARPTELFHFGGLGCQALLHALDHFKVTFMTLSQLLEPVLPLAQCEGLHIWFQIFDEMSL